MMTREASRRAKWFQACEPELVHLPETVVVTPSPSLAKGGAAFVGAILVITPIGAAAASLWLLLGPRAAELSRGDSVLFWCLAVFCLMAVPVGLSEARFAWRMMNWSRAITFGLDAVTVSETDGTHTHAWRQSYAAYDGLVVHVESGEMEAHSKQFITLRHGDPSRNVLLHQSQGNGLDAALRAKAARWAACLKVPALVALSATVTAPL